MIKRLYNSISLKIALLFSSVFLVLLLLLGYIFYGLFSQMFISYITQDLLVRGENHAKALADNFNKTTLEHVALMEKNVITNVVVTDPEKEILISSEGIDTEIQRFIGMVIDYRTNKVLNKDWENYEYLATVSPINQGINGYVYMFYPASLLREMVLVLKGLIALTSLGVVLIAIGFIIILSKRMTKPLLTMREATIKMAKGDYLQTFQVSGKDELEELAQSIQSLGKQLQYFEDTRNEFLASISHELRTPLTYIKGYSDVLTKGIVIDKAEQLEYLAIINEETKRVSHLVNDLFELSKIQTGQFTINKQQINLNILAEKVIKNLTPLANERGLSLQLVSYPKLRDLIADPLRLEQMLYNLIENSLKYTDKGEVIVIITQDGNFISLKVKDTGIGIPKEDLPRIWDRFYRVDKSRTRKTGGTGLGLFVVKEIVVLHDGEIDIESSEGEGTIVTIRFKSIDI